jgi:hypothetical protein
MATAILTQTADRENWLPDFLSLHEVLEYCVSRLGIARTKARAVLGRAVQDRQFRLFDKERRPLRGFDHENARIDWRTGEVHVVRRGLSRRSGGFIERCCPLVWRREVDNWLARAVPPVVSEKVAQAVSGKVGQGGNQTKPATAMPEMSREDALRAVIAQHEGDLPGQGVREKTFPDYQLSSAKK